MRDLLALAHITFPQAASGHPWEGVGRSALCLSPAAHSLPDQCALVIYTSIQIIVYRSFLFYKGPVTVCHSLLSAVYIAP